MINIDGSVGEGGGQVLRTALTLSMITGQAFRLQNIRARRQRPGLQPQHLAAVRAAAAVCQAQVTGACIGSSQLTFVPGAVQPGSYHFSVGTAGSATLVCQTVLPALLTASSPSVLVCEGGTHNPLAPSFEFLQQVYLPCVERMGPKTTASLERAGFYPKGGGRFVVTVDPVPRLQPLVLRERGAWQSGEIVAVVAGLPRSVAEREGAVLRAALPKQQEWRYRGIEWPASWGPGNAVWVRLVYASMAEMVIQCGEKGVPAEKVAQRALSELLPYLATDVPVGVHLADQLLLLLALAGEGVFVTMPLSLHTQTQVQIIANFLGTSVRIEPLHEMCWQVSAG